MSGAPPLVFGDFAPPRRGRGRPREDCKRVAAGLGYCLLTWHYELESGPAFRELAKILFYSDEHATRKLLNGKNGRKTHKIMARGLVAIGVGVAPETGDTCEMGLWFSPDCVVESRDDGVSFTGDVWHWVRGWRLAKLLGRAKIYCPAGSEARSVFDERLSAWRRPAQ